MNTGKPEGEVRYLNIETSERNGGWLPHFLLMKMKRLCWLQIRKTIRLPVNGIRIAGRVTQG